MSGDVSSLHICFHDRKEEKRKQAQREAEKWIKGIPEHGNMITGSHPQPWKAADASPTNRPL